MPLDGIADPRRLGTFKGIAWMVLTGLLFTSVMGIVRHLGSNLPAAEAAFIRYVFGLVLVAPALLQLKARMPPPTTLAVYVLRGAAHGTAVILWFYAMARIPIAEVTAIGYTTPIFTILGAALFLGERLQPRRVLAVAAGFLGAAIILRPGFQAIQIGSLAQLAAAPLFAVSFLLAKRLTRTESPYQIVLMLSVFCTLALLPAALWQWQAPTAVELFWLFLTAVFATAGHYALTRAFEAAPISVTQPISFLQLVWATLLGIVAFDERLDPFILLGGGIIVTAISYVSHREAKLAGLAARRPDRPPGRTEG